jgi:hypothetical protein
MKQGVCAAGLGLIAVLGLGSCGHFIEYTNDLRSSKDHTSLVRYTAQAGGVVGVIVSLPVDIVVLPVTVPVYLYQSSTAEEAGLSDSILFPSFALRGVGSLLAVPVDLIELALYRAWVDPDTPTAAEQEEIEKALDDDTLPRYPVAPIYPPKKAG